MQTNGAGIALTDGVDAGLHTTVMGSNVASETGAGGAIYLAGINTRAALVDCVVQYNRAGRGGGIAAFNQPTLTIANSYVEDNTANDYGGALSLAQLSSAQLHNVRVSYNFARVEGGALHVASGGQLVVSGSTFYRNSANQGSIGTTFTNATAGGVLALNAGGVLKTSAWLFSSQFRENDADHGGVLHTTWDNHLQVENCSFIDNIAHQHGGAVYLTEFGSHIFKNSTFTVNKATFGNGGAVVMEDNSAVVRAPPPPQLPRFAYAPGPRTSC